VGCAGGVRRRGGPSEVRNSGSIGSPLPPSLSLLNFSLSLSSLLVPGGAAFCRCRSESFPRDRSCCFCFDRLSGRLESGETSRAGDAVRCAPAVPLLNACRVCVQSTTTELEKGKHPSIFFFSLLPSSRHRLFPNSGHLGAHRFLLLALGASLPSDRRRILFPSVSKFL
jgi:hypothetical protein